MDQIRTRMRQLTNKIDQAKIVSFDMYNTLIFRKTRLPQDIFLLTEFYTGIDGFSNSRQKMQKKAAGYVRRKFGYPHANLREIYRFASCGRQKAEQAEQIERRLEERLSVCNARMRHVWQYARACGKRVIITSDMYLERSAIEKILRRCSITDWDDIYVSSDIRKTKYDGTLYDFILEKERVHADEMLHIGDDWHADIQMAVEKGIRTFWYRHQEADLAKSLYEISHSNGQLFEEKEMAFWYNLGYQTGGPLYMGLGLWLKKTIGTRRLCCLSRDGFNLTRMLSEFGITEHDYIYTSRRALLLAHMTKLGHRELELLPPYSCGQTVREILNYIGLELLPETEIRAAGLKGYDAVIRTKSDIAKMKQLYKKNENAVLKRCRKERMYLKQYFTDKDLFQKEMYFFDSGWNGTTQYLLQKIYESLHKKSSICFCYAGIKKSAVSQERLKGSGYHSYFETYVPKRTQNRLLDASAVLELFFSEDAPPVQCYTANGIKFDTYRNRDYIRWMNQGIADYISQHKVPDAPLCVQAAKRFGVCNLVKLVLEPDSREAARIGNLENADRLSEASGMKKHIAAISVKKLMKNPYLDIYWEKGVYRHPHNATCVKTFVWLRQRAAFVYKTAKRIYGRCLKQEKS